MKNEKGYALLIVLFLVVIIMVISTTFVSASVSNAKQGKTVDENNLSVVAAEMGVDYYKTAIVNEFNKKKVDLINKAQVEVNKLVNTVGFSTMTKAAKEQKLEEIRSVLIKDLEKYIGDNMLLIRHPADQLGTPLAFINEETKMYFKKLNTFEVGIISEGVIIEGLVIGSNKQRDKNLNFDITFKVPEVRLGDATGGSGSGGGNGIPVSYPDTSRIQNCSGDLKNKECKGGNTTPLSNLDNSTIYLTNGYFSNKGNTHVGSKNSTIYSNGTILVHNMQNMTGVTLISYGSITVNSNIQNMESTTVKVKGSFTINGNFMNMGNSKVCVDGSFTANGQLKNMKNSQIFVFPGTSGKVKAPKGTVTIVSTEAELWKNCGGSDSSSAVNMGWEDHHDMNVEY